MPSTLLHLWEGQCLHKAAPMQRGGPASFSQVSTRFFQAGGCPTRKPASQPEANQTSFFDSQKPAKPGKQRPDLARQPGPCRELIVQPFSGRPRRSTPGLLPQAHAWNCAIYFASFVGGAVPPQGRPPGQFQPGKYEIFPGRGMSNQKASQPARSQPNFFLIARSQPNQASRGMI